LILTVNTYLFKYVPVKLGFIILSLIGVLRIPEEFYLYKDKDTTHHYVIKFISEFCKFGGFH
jgi:23S rRNA maturation-related 3'-5' exoribonuclease YhaM